MSAGNDREFIDHLQNKKGKEQAMKCPMLTMYATTYTEPDKYQDRDCLKEECAWWDHDEKVCSFVSLTLVLDDVREQLAFIAKKMPHAGQFTK